MNRKTEAVNFVKSIANRHAPIREEFMWLSGECNEIWNLIVDALEEYQLPNEQKSDGYHTFGELYEQRAALFATVCHAYPHDSWIADYHHDGTMYEGMFIAGVYTPEGPYTCHIENEFRYFFSGLTHLNRAPEWDGHQPRDYTRLFNLKKFR